MSSVTGSLTKEMPVDQRGVPSLEPPGASVGSAQLEVRVIFGAALRCRQAFADAQHVVTPAIVLPIRRPGIQVPEAVAGFAR